MLSTQELQESRLRKNPIEWLTIITIFKSNYYQTCSSIIIYTSMQCFLIPRLTYFARYFYTQIYSITVMFSVVKLLGNGFSMRVRSTTKPLWMTPMTPINIFSTMPSNVQSFNEYTNKEGGDGSGPRLNTRSGNRHTRSSASGSRIVKHSNGNVVSGKGFNKSFNSSRGDGFRGGKSTTNPGSGSAFRNMGKERYGQGQPGRDRDQGQIFGSKYPPEKKKVYRSKTSPQEEIRTEFKKYLTVGLKTQDWTKALLHVQQRLEYNVIDEGKSVNGKLIATILNIYSKAGEYQKAYNLFLSIQNRLVGGKWLENSHYYRHIKLTSYHYQIILDACASHSESSASSSSGSAPADGSVRSKEPHPTTTTTGAGTAATVMRQPYEVALDIIHSMVNNGGNGLTRDVQLPTADMERYPRRGRPGRTPLPTAVHFTSAMLACMSARQFENAYDVFLLARK